tara:strand:+ start:181 stop:513 length:333 start_codon:yes stop_codon:yes gene_type:complete
MLFINFDNVPKGTKISGGLTSIRIVATLGKLKLLSFINSGYKPLKYEPNPKLHGWFVKKGNGGKSGEPLIRFNWGSRYSSFQAYNRCGKPRVSQNWYVAFKGKLMQKLVG